MARLTLKKRFRKLLKSPRLLLISSTLVVLSTTLVLSNKGLWRHLQLRHEIAQASEVDRKLSDQEAELKAQVALLQAEDPTTIERVARERYNLKKPGEVIYRRANK